MAAISERESDVPADQARTILVAGLRKQFVGPVGGAEEVLSIPPDRRYLMGTLYPQETDLQSQIVTISEQDDTHGSEEVDEESRFADDPAAKANSWLPSSLGMTLFTDASALRVTCRAAVYTTERRNGVRLWRRRPLPAAEVTVTPDRDSWPVLEERGELHVRWRGYAGATLVTVTLVNAAVAAAKDSGDKSPDADWDRMLFQVELSVAPVNGSLLEYPGIRLNSKDEEEQELRLQYRHVRAHAVGHGCAVEEEFSPQAPTAPVRLHTRVMPLEEVPRVTPSGGLDDPVLRLERLSDPLLPVPVLRQELLSFVQGYRDWYREQASYPVPAWGRRAADRILERIGRAVSRMETGVRMLCADPQALAAFRTANRAMALQMRRSAPDLGGGLRGNQDPVPESVEPPPTAAWRPFQLGFFLLAVAGLIDASHPDREIADVIWFPTGGGKTEAYLLLACFEMVLRRLRYGAAGGGTAVLSRYTLSLLTTQQFQRAATTVCALEYLRREQPATEAFGDLGDEPFSIGLWVGEATTPNTYADAHSKAEELRAAANPGDVFILDRCPWCGTRIVPEAKSVRASDYGFHTTETSFTFFCTRLNCAFHDAIPVAVVDEHLYDQPPSFVLGTVDKFARLAWEPRAGRLFGANGRRRPSLVLQDELHLLTGPLGTTVGLYESAILQLCGWDGTAPKVVASTATIRRSSDQVRRMYGRDVQLFPSPGLDARYSYFAEPDPHAPGRLYLGVMAQGHTSGRATVAAAAAMLHEAAQLPEEQRDHYWTLVVYHHSLRELGRTLTAARDDIPAQLAGLGSAGDSAVPRLLPEDTVQELTSNLDRREQPRLLARLQERGWPDPSAVSFLACTNMLSVGVDVGRLALMLILGQPKSAAEYIQATSRVGRERVPGLVVAFFNATKPRDRSHYETFGMFHRSLYRHVEPSSVTPWSVPSRRRALHAALVILLRHGHGWSGEDQAGHVLDRPKDVADSVDRLVRWVKNSDPLSADAVEEELRALVSQWQEEAGIAAREHRPLVWKSAGKGQRHLLKSFDRQGGLWETLHSLRSVDRECQVSVRGAEA